MLSRENKPLASIGEKRANWYVQRKGLAEDVQDEETKKLFPSFRRIIRLKFKAKMEDRTDPFYLEVKETQCVVCGGRENLSLHHVVPSCVRKHFPEEHKKHSHSWCVLLCSHHHHLADKLALELHEQELKDLEEGIRLHAAQAREAWGRNFIARQGGLEKVKELYREKFLQIEPQHLPSGFLEDHLTLEKFLDFPETSCDNPPIS